MGRGVRVDGCCTVERGYGKCISFSRGGRWKAWGKWGWSGIGARCLEAGVGEVECSYAV